MNRFVLSIGSNLCPRHIRVEDAINWLAGVLNNIKVSSIYETPEIHGVGKPYINAVLAGESELDMDSFNSMLKDYEISAGRTSECRKQGIVPIDIDIVCCNHKIIRESDYNSEFFTIGFLELAGFVVEE